MKFTHSLQFNAVPEWVSSYLDYGALKRLIYQLQKDHMASGNDGEARSLLTTDPDTSFRQALDRELERADRFYSATEAKIYDDLDLLMADVIKYEQLLATDPDADSKYSGLRRSTLFRSVDFEGRRVSGERDGSSDPADRRGSHSTVESYEGDDSGLLDEDAPRLYRISTRSGSTADRSRRRRSSSVGGEGYSLPDYHITLRKRTTAIYVSLNELKSFVDLNKTGFRKALKKYDKTLDRELRLEYMESVISKTYAFSDSTQTALDSRIQEAVELYARLSANNDVTTASEQLKLLLREHIVWERNTVWRDMIGLERRTQGTNTEGHEAPQYLYIGRLAIPAQILSSSALKSLVITAIFLAILNFPVLESVVQNNCLALVIGASLFWATEAMPLFITSLLVPLIVVVLRIPVDADGHRLTAPEASKFIFSQMWSSVIMILLGGFTLAAALSKYQIAKIMATSMLSRAGTNPRVVLFYLMFIATFLSMWISNVAAPVLCYSLAQPLLRTLPEGDEFAKAIILGIALASNVGGMVSPIASPQNIIALENMHPPPSWVQWFMVAIPVSAIGLVSIWLFLIFTFPTSEEKSNIPHIRPSDDKFTFVHYYICVVCVTTIVLWCFSRQLEDYIGEMGVLAIVPIVLLFGPGLLTSADFNNFLWTIIALAMGGIALGKAVSSSGLLATIANQVEGVVNGMSLIGVLLVFGLMTLVLATFVSHTVAALIILPLVESIGNQMADPHPRLLVMASALLCSAAMGLPTSGFPNVTAICMTDELGKPYLTVGNFISRGVPSSVLVYFTIVSLGYIIMRMIGF